MSIDHLTSRSAFWRTLRVLLMIALVPSISPLVELVVITPNKPFDRIVEGYVIDASSSIPVSAVQVIGDAHEAVSTFTDSDGHFFLSLKLLPFESSYSVTVRAPGYIPSQFRITSPIAAFIGTASKRSSLGVVHLRQDLNREVKHADRSRAFMLGPVLSGRGADFSPTYTVCSASPDEVPSGYAIKSVQFNLTGDRKCNAWATCNETIHNSLQVCWAFSLQGHSECLLPFGRCPDVRSSTGILHVTYGYMQSIPTSGNPQVAYVQFSNDKLASVARDLCNDLLKHGYFCPTPTILRGRFSSAVRIFSMRDASLGEEVRDIVIQRLRPGELPIVLGTSTSAPARGRCEVWLDGDK